MKKKFLLVIVGVIVSILANAQGQPGKMVQAQHAYQPFARNETNPEKIKLRNEKLSERGVKSRGFDLNALGQAISTSYKTTLVQKTVNATSNLVSFGVNLLSTWMNRNKTNREAWLKMAKAQCNFEKNLGTQTSIDDFYYEPSTSGALDPMNMKFNGFGCKGYLKSNDGKQNPNTFGIPTNNDKQLWEFYVACKLREDSIGLNHMANHSRFYVELDTLILDTRHLSLPNDSTNGLSQQKFDFHKRNNLTFRINIKVYSSWVNEAIMLSENQKIGEFNIKAQIKRSALNKDSIFVYDKTNSEHQNLVTLDGDCFLVPRSYTGTADAPSWGTGQYRLDVTVYESCSVKEQYYQEGYSEETDEDFASQPIKTVGNGQTIAFANTPGARKWDKKKWQAEWNEMQQRQKGASVWKNMWNSITTAYIGSDWVTELVSPAANAVYDQEAVALNELFKIDSSSQQAGGNGQAQAGGGVQTGGNTQTGNNGQTVPTINNGQGMPNGTPVGGGMPQQ